MNSVQMHLALTHVPVILSLVSLVMLIIAFILKNKMLIKTSYILLAIAGIAAIPVYFTGEGTEEAIENLPGVSEAVIERHEEVAKAAMISIIAAGLVALLALFAFKWQGATRVFKAAVFLLAIIAGGLMAQTAHLGGQIRHTEIRNGIAMENGNEEGEKGDGGNGQQESDND